MGLFRLTISMVVNIVESDMTRTTDPDARLLQGAADPTRLAIIRQLAGGDEVCACDFTACCDVAQPTISHHLKVLREAGWVSTRRVGLNIFYALRPEAVARFQALSSGLSPVGQPPRGRRLRVVQSAA
jgi:DNA-binding transcriptional ArsR family regulator